MRSPSTILIPLLLLCGMVVFEPPQVQAQGVRYLYDDLGRLKQVVDHNGEARTYSYDAVGNIVSIEPGDGGCPIAPPMLGRVTATTCYAGATCQMTISGNSLLGAGVSSANPLAIVSDCRTECTQVQCLLSAAFSLGPGPIGFTVATSLGSVQGSLDVVTAPALEAGAAAGIWHFAANAGQQVTLGMTRIANQPNGSSTLDPFLELQDSRGFAIALDDDSGSKLPPGPGKNALIQNLQLPATDTYIVVASGTGSTNGAYVLNIDPPTIILQRGAIVSPPEGRQIIFAGTIAAIDQRDTVTFAANVGDRATISARRVANNSDGSATLDPAVELYDSRRFLVAADSDTGTNDPPGPGRNALIPNFLLPATDTYRLVLSGEGGTTGPYQVIVTLRASSESDTAPATRTGGTP